MNRRALLCLLGIVLSGTALANPLDVAEFRVAAALSLDPKWDGPVVGPKAVTSRSIIFIAADLKNQGIAGAVVGVQEAASAIGWKLQVVDAEGDDAKRVAALKDAAAAHPDGVILGGFDALRYAPWIDNATFRGTTVVGWHAAFEPGMVPGTLLFTNVATSARQVALAAASYAVVAAEGKGGVVIFTDSNFSVAQAKANDMAVIASNCAGCELLSVENLHLNTVVEDMPSRLQMLKEKFGPRWTATLGINDLYFDAMAASGSAPAGLLNVSAGDGSKSAFDRIRVDSGQSATVAEPLNLQGWQLIDELNRAFAGVEPSGYVPVAHLVVAANVDRAGGDRNVYDPEMDYRAAYKKIWGR